MQGIAHQLSVHEVARHLFLFLFSKALHLCSAFIRICDADDLWFNINNNSNNNNKNNKAHLTIFPGLEIVHRRLETRHPHVKCFWYSFPQHLYKLKLGSQLGYTSPPPRSPLLSGLATHAPPHWMFVLQMEPKKIRIHVLFSDAQRTPIPWAPLIWAIERKKKEICNCLSHNEIALGRFLYLPVKIQSSSKLDFYL